MTNSHVVDHAKTVQVTLDDSRTLDAKVIGKDPKTDIALLKITESGSYPYVQFGKSAPRVGDWVVAIGNPFRLGGGVTAGIVSARDQVRSVDHVDFSSHRSGRAIAVRAATLIVQSRTNQPIRLNWPAIRAL